MKNLSQILLDRPLKVAVARKSYCLKVSEIGFLSLNLLDLEDREQNDTIKK